MTEEQRKQDQKPSAGTGAHQKKADEKIQSRSADPGQSSYGGFSGEDPRRQAQDLGKDAKDKPRR
ncbi:hypothetical protein [Bordetella sp. N]|uniref:hypothetical protein n=1 Tax=Bordetella sp. N TaxID=1746199 RepID=UPI00070F0046|nr:hypothetical protein [Bordetella sp. N]ALM84103.1 hypothetical protein ASB57_14975 [Bordetella sp. N]